MDTGKIDYGNIEEGDNIPDYKVKMARDTYFEYNKLVKEINPLHFDEEYAKGIGFKDIVVAGVYTFSFIPKMITDWLGEDGEIQSIEIGYANPIYIDEAVTYTGAVKKKYVKDSQKFIDCEIKVENVEGTRLIDASVTVKLS